MCWKDGGSRQAGNLETHSTFQHIRQDTNITDRQTVVPVSPEISINLSISRTGLCADYEEVCLLTNACASLDSLVKEGYRSRDICRTHTLVLCSHACAGISTFQSSENAL